MRESFWRNRYHNYMMAYYHYGLGYITLPNGDRVREGFLYQEPNPDYDRWLPENCKPVYFKDWLKDKIPEGLPKPKPGSRASIGMIHPRPVICIETGQFFIGVREAQKATGCNHVKDACRKGRIFDHELRFTFIDPFIEDEEVDDPFEEVNTEWKGHIKVKNFNPISALNNRQPILDETTGIEYESISAACKQLNTYSKKIRENTLPGHDFIYQWKEK